MNLRMAVLALALGSIAALPVLADEKADIEKYCKADIERLCKNVPMGGGEIIDCLKKNEKEMSVGCAEALKKLKS